MPLAPKTLPAFAVLEAAFSYDPSTGTIINRVAATSRREGGVADWLAKNGYRQLSLQGEFFYSHRIAWALFYKEEPPPFIDHKNGDKGDNRIENLRAATHSENMRNTRLRSDNSTGVKGVTRYNGLWRGSVTVGGRRYYLGQFPSKEEAASAVAAFRVKLHGEFARAV
jgi:hypothetical protein